MKKRTRVIIYIAAFVVTFITSALISMNLTGSAPSRLLKTDWNDNSGTIYRNLAYKNDGGHGYDLYIPSGLDKSENQNLILYIHGGSFNSGAKEDGDAWCKYYASRGCITATVDYTLQKSGVKADLNLMNEQIEACVSAIAEKCTELGYNLSGMATCGVSAGGTLAMNYAYKCAESSAVPVKFVFQLAGPSDFEPTDWTLLKQVNKIKTDTEFLQWMTGADITDEMLESGDFNRYVDEISPARLVNSTSVPTLVGYGLKDHAVPASSRILLLEALEKSGIAYDYIEFPNSNHGMYADLDKLQEFMDKSLEYCEKYFD
ncbi:MAG: alpha/beta hydrolase [Ruminiclostridium sp.]